jgi:transcriptional repressor NrdR
MHCPTCPSTSTRVVDSRLTEPGDAVRRRRECEECGTRFTTYERADELPIVVVKRDERREAFDRQKLLRGLVRAANKRPISDEQLDELGHSIAAAIRRSGREVQAEQIGELCLRGLAELDPVTAIQFASVYRNFSDLSELEAEVRRIRSEPLVGEGQLAIDEHSDPSDSEGNIGRSPAGPPRGAKEGPKPRRRAHAEHT